MKDFMKFIPFIQAYPFFVQIMVALLILFIAIVIVVLIIFKPNGSKPPEGNQPIVISGETAQKNSAPPRLQVAPNKIEVIQTIGSAGTGNGQFQFGGGSDSNAGVFVDAQYLYVTDWSNNRVQIFKLNNENVWSYTDSLLEQGDFYSDIFVDLEGNIYLQKNGEIAVYGSNKVLVSSLKVNISNFSRFTLDQDGNIFLQAGLDKNTIEKYHNNGELLVSFGGFGSSDGKFNNSGWTSDIVADSSGNVYMQDVGGGKIHKFDNNGIFISKWDVNISGYSCMAIDDHDNIYVVEKNYSELNKYNVNGKFIKKYFLPKAAIMGGGGYIFVKNNQLFISNLSKHNIIIYNLPR